MYSASDLFNKAYAYCIKQYDRVAILSAKYGLLLPDDEIEPYDITLNKMSVRKRKDWSKKVFEQMQQRLNLSDCEYVFFHAGKNYREYLMPELEDLGIKCVVPLENLRIGEQLRWYACERY
jgi:cytoplasmic iron level regulating protein YaaA (DUF328/UPF0246 family)